MNTAQFMQNVEVCQIPILVCATMLSVNDGFKNNEKKHLCQEVSF